MGEILIQIVDDNDKPLYGATKNEAWDQGLVHRIARVNIEDEDGNVLLQLRAASKWQYPSCYDSAVAGHVDEGEDYIDAARREMKEEIGLSGTTLNRVKHYYRDYEYKGKRLKRFITLYTARISHDTKLDVAEGEVADMRWVTPLEPTELMHDYPESIADGLRETYDIVYKKSSIA